MLVAIVAGMLDGGDPAVVAVAHRPIVCGDAPAVTCSGVLIAPRVVLTAAHCVTGINQRGELEVVFGPSNAQPVKEIVVQSYAVDSAYDPNTGDHDLATLVLAEEAAVAPIALPMATLDQLGSGAALRAVGYGVTGATAADPGTKREGTLALAAVRAARFDATPSPSMTCEADSGGPVLAMVGSDEQLVGVTSRGDGACAATATNARVDVALAPFVQPQADAGSNAPPGWPAQLTMVDAPCANDDQCPALMTCNEQGRCGLPWLGAGMFGGACTTTGDCGGSSRCVRVWPSGADACHCFASSIMPPGGEPPPGDMPTTTPPAGCGCASTSGDGAQGLLLLIALAWAAQRVLFHARDQRRA
ncbi:MAG: trypsin-like serine protease [Deltaproteobacteria bacterium]|nr:trypsin-like serine protease [Deltaproteobacteria bacterium]